MTVTSRTLPSRSATPVKVAPACVVLPFLTPAMPLYGVTPESPVSSRLVFWISKYSRLPVLDPAGELGADRRAVLAEVLLLHATAGDQREVVRGRDLAVGVVAVGGDDMGVERLEFLGVRLHVLDGLGDAAVHRGQHVDRVVARPQEDAEPQVVDRVGVLLLDADEAAALADARELGLRDLVRLVLGQLGQHGVGEQHLEGGGRGEPPVGVVRGEHLTALRVRDDPRPAGHFLGQHRARRGRG